MKMLKRSHLNQWNWKSTLFLLWSIIVSYNKFVFALKPTQSPEQQALGMHHPVAIVKIAKFDDKLYLKASHNFRHQQHRLQQLTRESTAKNLTHLGIKELQNKKSKRYKRHRKFYYDKILPRGLTKQPTTENVLNDNHQQQQQLQHFAIHKDWAQHILNNNNSYNNNNKHKNSINRRSSSISQEDYDNDSESIEGVIFTSKPPHKPKNMFNDLQTPDNSFSPKDDVEINSNILQHLFTMQQTHQNLYDSHHTRYNNNQHHYGHTLRSVSNNTQYEDIDTSAENYVPGVLTNKKQHELGTVEAVQESRRQYFLRQENNKELATRHLDQMLRQTECRLPQPRIIHIQIDASKRYTPHCTVLHMCADDTGCCKNKLQTCAPNITENIDLYFFAHRMNEQYGYIERITFVNHTKCHCVDRVPDRHNRSRSSSSPYVIVPRAVDYEPEMHCNCPNWFEKILNANGSCRCDCSSGNGECERFKNGLEHFSIDDRKCIKEGRCKVPTCQHGVYMPNLGSCPRREENIVGVTETGPKFYLTPSSQIGRNAKFDY